MFNIFSLFNSEDKYLNLLQRIKNKLDILEIKIKLIENKLDKYNYDVEDFYLEDDRNIKDFLSDNIDNDLEDK